MRTVVCVKQVPDTAHVRINPNTMTLEREGVPAVINPFDLYAVEEALRIREILGGTTAVLSMGPPQVAEALREVVAMGVDEGYLLSDREFAGADTLATSYTLSRAIAKIGAFDLVLCGKQAVDGDTAQVGPELAEHLNLPFLGFVRRIREIRPGSLLAERMTEEGADVVETPLPAVISVVKEINQPRLPSLKGKIRAKGFQPVVWKVQDLDLDPERIGLLGSPTRVVRIFTPEPRPKGEIFQGDPASGSAWLADKIRALGIR
jgi:electron transfer flavoprotein beta subunit